MTTELEKAIQEEIKQIPEKHLQECLRLIKDFRQQKVDDDPILGSFADEPELIDEIVAEAMADREKQVLRRSSHE